MSLNLFFMYCAASSCWAGLQATISEHLRTSSGPRGRQQRPQPAGQMQHSPGNVWSSSVLVGDKIKESGVNLTWKKMKLKSLQQFILTVSKSLDNQMQLPKDPWRNERSTPKNCIFWKYVVGGSYYTPGWMGLDFFWTMSFYSPKKFILRFFIIRVQKLFWVH